MGSSDIPPPGVPDWVVPLSTALLGTGISFWLITYVLMIRRSLATKATPIPLLALAINLSWEVIFALFVADSLLEKLGFTAWLLFDIPVLYVTFKTAPQTFRYSPLVKNHVVAFFLVTFAWGCWANWYFVTWWLEVDNRGSGDKTGKYWMGVDKRDMTELSWWTAGVAQLIMSVGSLAMVVQRGHSGGQSFSIWATRFLGTVTGLPLCCFLLYYHWPQAHGFVLHPHSFVIVGTSIVCDLAYPCVLAYVKTTEKVLSDGTVVADWEVNPSRTGVIDETGKQKKG